MAGQQGCHGQKECSWLPLKGLTMQYFCHYGNFPIHHFPDELRQVILAIHAKTKAPVEIVAASVLTAISIATQHLARVQRPPGPISPIALALLTLAGSGDRKTSADDETLPPIRAFEAKQEEHYHAAMARHEVEMAAWNAYRAGLTRKITERGVKGESDTDLVSQLQQHQDRKPLRPQLTRLIYADATPQALGPSLHTNSPSAALHSNEASKLLFGPALENLGFLSEIWSSGTATVDRASSESFSVKNVALTISLMVQPSEFERYLKGRGAHARGSGFFARCLFAKPLSIQGFRQIFPNDFFAESAIEQFHHRLMELLETNSARPTGTILKFDGMAAMAWTDFFNETECLQQPGSFYSDIGDFASKIADNASRIAAIFCIYEGKTDSISLSHIQHAIEVSKWYLAQFKTMFGSSAQIPEDQQDAMLLHEWLMKFLPHNDGFIYVDKSYILQRGPNRVRISRRLNAALACMEFSGCASQWKHDRKTVIRLNPSIGLFRPALPAPTLNWL
jgi:hypothetical protein